MARGCGAPVGAVRLRDELAMRTIERGGGELRKRCAAIGAPSGCAARARYRQTPWRRSARRARRRAAARRACALCRSSGEARCASRRATRTSQSRAAPSFGESLPSAAFQLSCGLRWQHIAEGAQRCAQAAQADAQLMQVLRIVGKKGAARVQLDLLERRVGHGPEGGSRRSAAQRRRAPRARRGRREIGVTDGIRTHNNWNHNPGLYR